VLTASGDDYGAGFALMILGAASGTQGEPDRGEALLHEALAIARQAADRWLEASCLGYLGTVLASAGEGAAARRALEEGLAGVRALGDHRAVGWMLITLARIARAGGDPAQARARVAEALAVQRRLGDVWGVSNALRETAALDLDDAHGDPTAVRAVLAESLCLAATVQDRPTIAAVLGDLARLSARRAPDRAARLLGCAASLGRPLNDPTATSADTHGWVATLRDTLGDPAFADNWACGRAMSAPDAVAYALDDDESATAHQR
jgi:hypothetical protein